MRKLSFRGLVYCYRNVSMPGSLKPYWKRTGQCATRFVDPDKFYLDEFTTLLWPQ
jgi:hypothetical protein